MEALKEWAVVCKALEEGRQVILLRKGGIMEYRKGFEVRHERFLMFPTYEHQSSDHLQPDYAGRLDEVPKDAPPAGTSMLTSFAQVLDVKEVTDRSVLKRLEHFHVWNESYVKARMDYNPSKPMSVMLVRVFKLGSPIQIETREEWAGCKSWVPVNVDVGAAEPALTDSEFGKISYKVREALSIAA